MKKPTTETVQIELLGCNVTVKGEYSEPCIGGENDELLPSTFSAEKILTENGTDISELIFNLNEYYFAQAKKMLKNIGLTDNPVYINMNDITSLIEEKCIQQIEPSKFADHE